MSHISTFSERIKNVKKLVEIAKKCGYEVKEDVTVTMFGSQKVFNAVSISLPKWGYPVAISSVGDVLYDFFGAEKGPGVFEQLGSLVQNYNEAIVMDEIQYDCITSVDTIENKTTGDRVITITI